jgi:excisionase family DNA binding protein
MYLTPDEAARVTGRNPEAIRMWIRSGQVPAIKVGHRWLLPAEALEALNQRPRLNLPRPLAP